MSEEDFILIEQYINGELEGKLLDAFTKRLETDVAFADEVALRKKMDDFLAINSSEGISKEQLKSWNRESFEKLERPPKEEGVSRRMWMTVAASLLFLIAAAFLFNQFSKNNSKDLYSKYAVHQTLEVGTKSGRTEIDDLKSQAADAFNKENYVQSTTLINRYLGLVSEDSEMKLFLGISMLESGDTANTEAFLKQLANGSTNFKEEGKWYLALYYLKYDKIEACKTILLQLEKEDGFRAKNARNLLKDLK